MSIVTNWGYTLTELEELPGLLSLEEFNTFTANKYAGDMRISSEISAACASIRNCCGWHISPAAACELEEHILYEDGRIKRRGSDLMIQLPARFVASVSNVMINDDVIEDYILERNGILWLLNVDPRLSRKTKITVAYTAGLDDLPAIKELIAHMVTHALAVPAGITSEAAGGVSVTYNASWVKSARATALPDDNREVLAPYRLEGVF